jgi:hypothetical protein
MYVGGQLGGDDRDLEEPAAVKDTHGGRSFDYRLHRVLRTLGAKSRTQLNGHVLEAGADRASRRADRSEYDARLVASSRAPALTTRRSHAEGRVYPGTGDRIDLSLVQLEEEP